MRSGSYLIAALFVLISVSAAAAGQGGDAGPVDVLLGAGHVDDAGVGFAGKRTDLYAAFAQLYSERALAVAGAKRLLRDGTPAAKVYGYIVLHHAAADEAAVYGRTLQDDSSRVLVMSGCVGTRRTVGELVRAIDCGEFVIAVPPGPSRDSTVRLVAP